MFMEFLTNIFRRKKETTTIRPHFDVEYKIDAEYKKIMDGKRIN